MRFSIKHTIPALLLATATMGVAAQNVNSGYFLDYYTYRHQLNPAFTGSDRGYVGFPGLGNINVGAHGNLHMTNVVFNRDNKTVLFTDPAVSIADVMDGLHDKNALGAGVKIGIIDCGFKAFGGYNTIGINAVANADVTVPKALFSLLKEGVANKTYDIHDLKADAVGYAEIALNHSREIKQVPGLRVGASLKFLVGIAALQTNIKTAELALGTDSWVGTTDAEVYTSMKGFRYDTKYNSKTHQHYVNGAKVDDFSAPNGFGLAFDLGAEYKWTDFTFSAALLDLGFISFGETHLATTEGRRWVDTDKYTFEVSGPDSDDEWDNLADDISSLYQMTDKGDIGSHNYTLKATMNLGVAYDLPIYRAMTFGLLNTTRFNGPLTSTEFRLSANWQPCKTFSANVNGVAGTYGLGFGWMLNVHTTGFNFFLGSDHTPGRFSKQCVPMNSNADVFLGINFPI